MSESSAKYLKRYADAINDTSCAIFEMRLIHEMRMQTLAIKMNSLSIKMNSLSIKMADLSTSFKQR